MGYHRIQMYLFQFVVRKSSWKYPFNPLKIELEWPKVPPTHFFAWLRPHAVLQGCFQSER